MWNAETRYSLKVTRPFPSCASFKSVPLRAVATSASPSVVCWICDAPGHRATTCPKRMPSGCARCGSKAYELLVCPQRPDPRKSGSCKVGEGSGCVGREEDPIAEQMKGGKG